MTPTTAAAASSLRSPYDPIVAGAPVDTSYEGPYSPGDAGAFVGDASTYGGGEVVSGGGDVAYRSADTSYVDDGGGAYYGTDATDAFSAVAGTQPAISNAPTATLDDLAALGIFRDDELQQLAQSDLSPEDLGALYDEAIRFMQSPEFNDYQLMLQQEQAAGGGDVPAGTAPANTDSYAAMDSSPQGGEPATWSQDQAPGSSEPAWNGEWNDRFQAALKDQGFDSKTRMMVTAQLRSLPLSESDLQQAFDYYTNTAEGRAELEQVDQQVRDGKATELKMTLGMGALALAGVAGTTALASSTGNLTHVLQRTAINGASDATKAAARAALREVTAGTLDRSGTIAREAASALRSEASATSRLFHPLRKAATNAAARNLTEASRLSRSDLVKYGLWMKQGDAVADVASSAVKAGGAAAEAGTAAKAAAGAAEAATAAKAAGGAAEAAVAASAGVDDAARGAMALAKGAGAGSKVAKALGPIGLVIGAGVGIWGISKTMEAEGGFGEESAKMTGNVAGGLAGGVAGAAAGAAIGSVVPVIGTGIGAIVGGIVGGFGGGAVGEALGGALHGLFG